MQSPTPGPYTGGLPERRPPVYGPGHRRENDFAHVLPRWQGHVKVVRRRFQLHTLNHEEHEAHEDFWYPCFCFFVFFVFFVVKNT